MIMIICGLTPALSARHHALHLKNPPIIQNFRASALKISDFLTRYARYAMAVGQLIFSMRISPRNGSDRPKGEKWKNRLSDGLRLNAPSANRNALNCQIAR
jgi:hypothetical protein